MLIVPYIVTYSYNLDQQNAPILNLIVKNSIKFNRAAFYLFTLYYKVLLITLHSCYCASQQIYF